LWNPDRHCGYQSNPHFWQVLAPYRLLMVKQSRSETEPHPRPYAGGFAQNAPLSENPSGQFSPHSMAAPV
jgi:hypothetical protein